MCDKRNVAKGGTLKKVAISIGDINGVGLEIALKAHNDISKIIKPTYFVDFTLLESATKILKMSIPRDFEVYEIASFCTQNVCESIAQNRLICPSQATKESGEYSFISFLQGIKSVERGDMSAILTLPINKFAWKMAGIDFIGHTEFLRDYFGKNSVNKGNLGDNLYNDSHQGVQNGIMMLGCDEMFVALFTDHIPLNAVSGRIEFNALCEFLLSFHTHFSFESALVLGLNPHAGDGGILGSEDKIIQNALECVNAKLGAEIYKGIVAPDSAFRVQNRKKFKVFVAMYHDQGLSILKALYAEKSINVTLGIPILRVSVEHGTGFDIAYKGIANTQSYIEAAQFIANY